MASSVESYRARRAMCLKRAEAAWRLPVAARVWLQLAESCQLLIEVEKRRKGACDSFPPVPLADDAAGTGLPPPS